MPIGSARRHVRELARSREEITTAVLKPGGKPGPWSRYSGIAAQPRSSSTTATRSPVGPGPSTRVVGITNISEPLPAARGMARGRRAAAKVETIHWQYGASCRSFRGEISKCEARRSKRACASADRRNSQRSRIFSSARCGSRRRKSTKFTTTAVSCQPPHRIFPAEQRRRRGRTLGCGARCSWRCA